MLAGQLRFSKLAGNAMIIPSDAVSEAALDQLIKDYCLRDWGLNETEAPLQERCQQVKAAVEAGSLVILYSELHETAQLIAASELNAHA